MSLKIASQGHHNIFEATQTDLKKVWTNFFSLTLGLKLGRFNCIDYNIYIPFNTFAKLLGT